MAIFVAENVENLVKAGSLRTQGRRSAAARRVPPTTHRSCRRVPPAAWPASPGGGADWVLRQPIGEPPATRAPAALAARSVVLTPDRKFLIPSDIPEAPVPLQPNRSQRSSRARHSKLDFQSQSIKTYFFISILQKRKYFFYTIDIAG